jgi:hypothetical protein
MPITALTLLASYKRHVTRYSTCYLIKVKFLELRSPEYIYIGRVSATEGDKKASIKDGNK